MLDVLKSGLETELTITPQRERLMRKKFNSQQKSIILSEEYVNRARGELRSEIS